MNIGKLLKLFHYIFYLSLFAVLSVIACYFCVSFSARQYIYSDINKLPKRDIGLVLGTSKYLSDGSINEYYQYRIDTAVKLYKMGKVKYFIVSGDNRRHNYNEPKQMREDLVKAGVPLANIQPDYAGLRTLDSILRADKVFGHKSYTIISQYFHNERALFLAYHKGQQPIAFNAPNATQHFKVALRELFARVKAVMDLLTNKKAKHYGKPIAFPAKTMP